MKFLFLGDYFLANNCVNLAHKHLHPNVNLLMSQHDVCICNLEAPLKAPSSQRSPKLFGPALSQSSESLSHLKSLGVTHVSIYNNHIADYGEKSIIHTISELNKVGIIPLSAFNIFADEAGHEVHLYNSGMLEEGSVYSILEKYGTHFSANVPICKKNNIINIAYSHFGSEYLQYPTNSEINYLRLLSLEFDLVLRTHPHIAQNPIYINNCHVFQSLGDFIFHKDPKSLPHLDGIIVSYDSISGNIMYYQHSLSSSNIASLIPCDHYESAFRAVPKNLIKDRYSKLDNALPLSFRFLVKYIYLIVIFGDEVKQRFKSRLSAHSFEAFILQEFNH